MATESLDHVMVGGGIPVAVHVNVMSSNMATLASDAVVVVIEGISVIEKELIYIIVYLFRFFIIL